MPDDHSQPRTILPEATPKALRDFVRCRSDSVDIQPGPVDWLPNMPPLTLSFDEGADGWMTLRVVGLGGAVDISIPMSIQAGRLVANTSDLMMGDGISDWIDDLNADFEANGMQLSGASIRDGKLHLTKGATTAGTATTVTGGAQEVPQPPLVIPPPPRHVTDPIPAPVEVPPAAELEPDAPAGVRRFFDDWSLRTRKGKVAMTGGILLLGAAAYFLFVDQGETPPVTLVPALEQATDQNSGQTTDAGGGDTPPGDDAQAESDDDEPPPSQSEDGDDESASALPGFDEFEQSHFADLNAFAATQGLDPSLVVIRSDPAGDFDVCGPNSASGADILGVAASQVGNTVTAAVWMAQPPTTSDTQFSFAVVAEATSQSGISRRMLYEVHDGHHTIGEQDATGNIDPESDAVVTINDTAVVFSFSVEPADPLALLFVEGFNLLTDGEAIGCDNMTAPAVPFPTGASTLTGSCIESETSACLSGGRFGVEVLGAHGKMLSIPASDDDAGLFAEDGSVGVVRVLNACETNESFWVFSDGFKSDDVSTWITITVTDTTTDEVKSYDNPLGAVPASIQDTSAFTACP